MLNGWRSYVLAQMILFAIGHQFAYSVEELNPGAVVEFARADASCVTTHVILPDAEAFPFIPPDVSQDCSDKILVQIGSGDRPSEVIIHSSTRHVLQFRVPSVPDAPPTFLPVHITLFQAKWKGRLLNESVVPQNSVDIDSDVSVNSYLRLNKGNASNPADRGDLIDRQRFQGASHGGADACISVPTTAARAAKLLVRCLGGLISTDEGQGLVSISAVIETGVTYNIEVDVVAELDVPNALLIGSASAGFFAARAPGFGDLGVSWEKMVVAVGSDHQEGDQELREEIMELRGEVVELRDDLNQLRSEFEGHTHTYLTGRGLGHNNTSADTGTPKFEAGRETLAFPAPDASGGADASSEGGSPKTPKDFVRQRSRGK